MEVDRGGKVQVQLGGLAVGQVGNILEGAIQEVVHINIAHVVTGDNNGAHGQVVVSSARLYTSLEMTFLL